MSTIQDPLTDGCMQRLLHARRAYIEAKRIYNDAAEDLLRSFGDEFEDDISTMAHVIGGITVVVDEDWSDFQPGERHMALTFLRTATYAEIRSGGPA